METLPADYTLVEATLQRRLAAMGLQVRSLPCGVDTGLGRLEIYRSGAQVLEVQRPDGQCLRLASVEFRAVLEHPGCGPADIRDLITHAGETSEEALRRCAQTFMQVHFPALYSLFTLRPAPGTMELALTSCVPSQGTGIRWSVFSGQLQTLGPDAPQLAERFTRQPPVVLALDALSGRLAEPRLHWCKLFGRQQDGVSRFGCTLDGEASPPAEEEMLRKFTAAGPVAGVWEFRQFLVLQPAGAADRGAIEALSRDETAESAAMASPPAEPAAMARPAASRGWWRRWWG